MSITINFANPCLSQFAVSDVDYGKLAQLKPHCAPILVSFLTWIFSNAVFGTTGCCLIPLNPDRKLNIFSDKLCF